MTGTGRSIEDLANLLKSDALEPTSAIFPNIDTDTIARQIGVTRKAADRGGKDLPRSEEGTLDSVEASVVESIEERRRKGLQAYEDNKEVYSRRLSQASTARLHVKSVAGKAEGDFAAEVKESRGHMSGLVDELRGWHVALGKFKQQHRLDRPAYANGGVAKTAAILLLCIMGETVLNGYLFAQKNELGYLGGFMISALVSVVNVGLASYAGFYSRLSRHRHPVVKFFGIAIVLGWIGLTGLLNLAIAHFRDAVETLGSWSEAVKKSLEVFAATPFALTSIESWLLMVVGCLISLAAFLKLMSFGEPYPGYGRISRRYEGARDDYAYALSDALDGLREKRDAAIAELEEANRLVRDSIGDAVDALYGQRLIRAHLAQFLAQCDLKVNVLLKTYRDENRAKRKTPAPAHFDEDYSFAEFSDGDVEESHRVMAEREVEEIGAIVDAAIEAIHSHYRAMIDEFPDPHILTGTVLPSARAEGQQRQETVSDTSRFQVVSSTERP